MDHHSFGAISRRSAIAAGAVTLPFWMARPIAAQSNSNGQASGPKNETGNNIKITNVRCILTAPAGIRLAVVRVDTNQPGLFGLGCATFTQRIRVVETAVEKFLKPFLIGKSPLNIEDLWQSMYLSSYWRNSGVLNNAISGVDMACWDILGKHAGLPVWQLLGGKARRAVDTYRHASGQNFDEVADSVQSYLEKGYRHVRVQVAIEGQSTYGSRSQSLNTSTSKESKDAVRIWEPREYTLQIPKLFEHLRKKLGFQVELLHDTHERIPPALAFQLCRDLEPFKLFFLEDPFSPEDVGYFKLLRQQTSTPLAMGELFNNPNEFVSLISERLIDFIRIHISQIGGLTPARKVAALCEFFGVRTAWHGPGDVSPVGHACNVHLDLAIHNFGIQEGREFTQAEQDAFPGCPKLEDGYYWANDEPGWGIQMNESITSQFPIEDDPPFDMSWGNLRRKDGTVTKP